MGIYQKVTERINDIAHTMEENCRNKYKTFLSAATAAGISLPDDPEFTAALKQVFSFSDFVGKSCTLYPELLDGLIRSGDLQKPYPPGEYDNILKNAIFGLGCESGGDFQTAVAAGPDDELASVLRQVRRREMIRIAWRDLAGWAGLNETLSDLSAFADAVVDYSLEDLYRRQCSIYGTPVNGKGLRQRLVVFGMGKLGARELNFSSDIDVIFAFPESGFTTHTVKPISNADFFTRLCQKLIRLIGKTTSEGFVFRVDTRLRPFGESGPLVISFDAMEDYYQRQGREWERYAWIKARIIAGDKKAGTRLRERLKPFIYRRYLDFGAFESLRDMKKKISIEVKRRDMQDNIKLGPGGIREVEFFGQVFQLIRGGVVPALQTRGIKKVLNILVSEGYIPEKVRCALTEGYDFLRRTENRLQAFEDQQVHILPVEADAKMRLAASMGYADWNDFEIALRKHMQNVHFHFKSLLQTEIEPHADKDIQKELHTVWIDSENVPGLRQAVVEYGFDAPDEVILLLENLRTDSTTRALSRDGRERLNRLMPRVLKAVGKAEKPLLVLRRILDLIQAIERRTNYLALLLESPKVLPHLIRLSSDSPWIVAYLAQHPVLLDELVDPRSLYAPVKKRNIEHEIQKKIKPIDSGDLENQIQQLCIIKQVNTLRVAAADVSGELPLMRVSDFLTDIAEAVLNEVLNLSWNHLVKRHGRPTCRLEGKPCHEGFAIIAYGKLGGIELGYSSDLDLVFLHAGIPGQTDGDKKPIENTHFFSRLGQRFIHILTSRTAAGTLYDIDMRLRPSGSSGILVSQIDAFETYQMEAAWTWEHQALIKARAIGGTPALMDHFERIRRNILSRRREKKSLLKEAKAMRERMRAERLVPEPGSFDLKQGIGGMVDIEFLVQYLVLLMSYQNRELLDWTDNVRLLQTLIETGAIDEYTAHLLKHAYLIYRATAHKLSLQQKPPIVSDDRFDHLHRKVAAICKFYMP